MAIKRITQIGKPLDTSFGYKYREVVSSKLEKEGLDFDSVSSMEQNRAFQKIHIDNQRDSLKSVQDQKTSIPLNESDEFASVAEYSLNLFRDNQKVEHGEIKTIPLKKRSADPKEYEQLISEVWNDKRYTQEAKEKFARGMAKSYAGKVRNDIGKEFQSSYDMLDAQERDIERSRNFGILKSVYQSTALGVEMLLAPARLIAQGEEVGMAYQEAAQNLAYHVPNGTVDKFLNLAAANAFPMGATIAAHLVPVIGPALGAGLMSSYMGSNMYLELRRKGVDKDIASTTAVIGGIALGAVEYATGHALSATAGKIPVVGKLFGSASRADRLRALGSLTGKKGGITALYKAVRGHTANLSTLNKGMAAVFGSQSSRAGVLANLAREGGTGALTGGVEEWIQTGIELALSEQALKASGLQGVIPRYPDGTINGEAVMSMMNEAFMAGLMLEGVIGSGIAMTGLNARMNTAKSMGVIKNMLNGEIATNKDGYAVNMNQLSGESKDYIARRILMDLTIAEQGKELTQKERFKIVETSKKKALSSLTDNPIEALFVDYSDAKIESIKDGEIAIIKIGKDTIPIVKSENLGESGAKYIQNPDGSQQLGVTPEVWQQLEKLGLNKNVIAINLYQGSTLPHEVLHHVIRNLSADEQSQVLDMFNDENLDLAAPEGEASVQEQAAAGIEQYIGERRSKPTGNAFKDAYARIEVAVRGDKASDWAKKRMLYQGVVSSIETGKPVSGTEVGVVSEIQEPLGQKKGIGRPEAVTAFKNYQTEQKVLNDKLSKYVDAYAVKNNLSDTDKQAHANFLTNTIQSLLESDIIAGADEGSIRANYLSEHINAINTIKQHTGRMRGFAKRLSKYGPIESKSMQMNSIEFLTSLSVLSSAGEQQAQWTPEMQNQYNALIEQAEREYKARTFISQTTEDITKAKEFLDGPEFEPIAGIVNEGIIAQNAKVKKEVAIADIRANREILDPQAEIETQAYSEGIATADVSSRVVSKPVGFASEKSAKLANMLSSRNLTALFPLTLESYNDIFGKILDEVFDNQDVSVIQNNSNFENGVLQVGNTKYDLNNPADLKTINELTKVYGPMWAIAVELNKYVKGKGIGDRIQQVTNQVDGTIASMKRMGRPTPKPNILRAVSAFITVASQSNSLMPIQIQNTEVSIPMKAQVIANDLVVWFKDVAGLPSDGSPVDFADLGGQYQSAEQVVSPDLLPDLQQLLDSNITAEAAVRSFVREFVELFNPALVEQDLSKETYQTQQGGKQTAGAAVSPAFISKIGISRKSTAGPLQSFITFDVRDTIGELLNRISNRYGAISNLVESGTSADTGIIDGIEDIANGAVELAAVSQAATEAGIIPDLTEANLGTELKAMQKLASDIFAGSNKTDAYANAVEAYLVADPEMTQLNELIQRLQKDVNYLDLAQAKRKVDTKDVFDLLEIQDKIFGLKDIQNAKVQIDSLKTTKAWDKIFSLETPMRFRDLIKDLAKTASGVISGKPVIAELKTDSAIYQAATIFALDYMNTTYPKVTAGKVLSAINNKIEELQSIKKRTVEEDYILAKYRQYLRLQPFALEIISGEGKYGAEIKGFIEQTYKPLTDSYWNDFGMDNYNRAVKVDYYSPRVFVEKLIESQEGEFEMATNTGRLIRRQSIDLSAAMKKGRVFAYDNFMPALIAGMGQIINTQANERLIESGLRDGFFSIEKKVGFELLQASGAKDVKYTVTSIGEIFDNYTDAMEASKDKNDILLVKLDLYAPAEVAQYLNKITKSSTMRKNPYVLGLLATNAKLKGLKIVWGMFHRRSFIWSAMIAGAVTPGMEFTSKDLRNPSELMKKLRDRTNYSDKRKLGLDIMQQGHKTFYDLTYYGMTTFRIQDIGRASQQYKTKAEKWLGGDTRGITSSKINQYMQKFSGVTHRFQDELFGIFGSSLKSATAYNEYMGLFNEYSETIAREKQQSKTSGKLSEQSKSYAKLFPAAGKKEADLADYYSKTEEDILRAVAGMANADFGGLHTGRLGVTKDFQDTMRLLFLGPDWTASNIISALKLRKSIGTSTDGPGTVFSGSQIEHDIYKRFWLRIIARSLMLATVINALMAGMDDESTLQRLKKAKRKKGFKFLMADISPAIHMLGGDKGVDHYFNASGHFLDIPKIATDPVRMAYHKSSSVLKPAIDLATGTRYDHKRPAKLMNIGKQGVYTWKNTRRGPVSPSEAPAFALYQMSQVLPIQIRNIFNVAIGEENAITGTLKAGLGLDIKRTYGKE